MTDQHPTIDSRTQQSVLFVCLGNICRSPTAHAVFRYLVEKENLQQCIKVDSAGTGDWHVGGAPDGRATEVARQRDYKMDDLIARQVTRKDFNQFDYILAMDCENLRNLEKMQPSTFSGHLSLFLDFSDQTKIHEVPDPYYGGDEGFEQVLDLVESASFGLLDRIKQTLV